MPGLYKFSKFPERESPTLSLKEREVAAISCFWSHYEGKIIMFRELSPSERICVIQKHNVNII